MAGTIQKKQGYSRKGSQGRVRYCLFLDLEEMLKLSCVQKNKLLLSEFWDWGSRLLTLTLLVPSLKNITWTTRRGRGTEPAINGGDWGPNRLQGTRATNDQISFQIFNFDFKFCLPLILD